MAFGYRPLVAALGVVITGSAWPQQAAERTLNAVQIRSNRDLEPTYNPPTSASATKIEAPLRDIPQTVNVVPRA